MIKKLMLGAVIASMAGSAATAQPSQQQGGAQAGVGGTSDTTKSNDKAKGGMNRDVVDRHHGRLRQQHPRRTIYQEEHGAQVSQDQVRFGSD